MHRPLPDVRRPGKRHDGVGDAKDRTVSRVANTSDDDRWIGKYVVFQDRCEGSSDQVGADGCRQPPGENNFGAAAAAPRLYPTPSPTSRDNVRTSSTS